MALTNELGANCRNYPVKWWVKNLGNQWPGYVVDWRLQLTLVNPLRLDEGGDRLLIKGRGDSSGVAQFRMCGLKHTAGKFEARATIASWGQANGDCSPAEPTASYDRSCTWMPSAGRDRETFTTSFKRPSKVTVILRCTPEAPSDSIVRIGGRVVSLTDSGTWRPRADRVVLIEYVDWFALGDGWDYLDTTTTDADGWYRSKVPLLGEAGGEFRARALSTWSTLPASVVVDQQDCSP